MNTHQETRLQSLDEYTWVAFPDIHTTVQSGVAVHIPAMASVMWWLVKFTRLGIRPHASLMTFTSLSPSTPLPSPPPPLGPSPASAALVLHRSKSYLQYTLHCILHSSSLTLRRIVVIGCVRRQVKVYDATSSSWFEQAAEYWNQAILLAPSNYIEAHNWLKMTGGF